MTRPHERAWLAAAVAAGAFQGACDPPVGSGSGGEVGRYTVVEVQHASEATCPEGLRCPAVGSRVVIENVVVTATDSYDEDGEGRTGNAWIQDPVPAGGPWSGVQLFVPTVVPARTRLVPGDVVRVVGTLDEFVLRYDDGSPMDRKGTLTELRDASIQKTGEYLAPAPVTIAGADLGDRLRAEPWEGVLVRVEDVVFTGGYDSYGDATTNWGVEVANDLYEIPGVAAGVRVAALSGVVTYFFGFKVLPRGPEDIEW